MNGAHALLATMLANDVDVCFANPGTSEMHFVAGLEDFARMRSILCLFEGVATGAADGYARVAGRPASTLLHLGPGLANGWANLHNARRARTPVLNVVGDHATYHGVYDAPLQSDIASIASALNGWQCRSETPDAVAGDAARAIGAAWGPPGRVATLVLPSDVSWGEVVSPPASWPTAARTSPSTPAESDVARAIELLRTRRCALFLGGSAMRTEPLALAQRVARATGCRVISETFPAIAERGAGVANPERLYYLSEFAIHQLADVEALILVGSVEPVGFFAYPNVASRLVATDCEVVSLAPPGTDAFAALCAVVDGVGHDVADEAETGEAPAAPTGELTAHSLADAIGATLPENVVIADEGNTAGLYLHGATRFCAPHRWMTLTGGSIGLGLPLAVGAAVASSGRVLAVEADGSMMYTPQSLWTMAREGLDVTVVALANRSYAVLELERQRVGAPGGDGGAASSRMLEIDDPTLDLAGVARSLGVPGVRVDTADDLVRALERSYATPGPSFIEAVLPKGLG